MKLFSFKVQTLAWLGLLTVCLACQSKGQESKGQAKFMRMGPAILQQESYVEFYGKVLDQNINPIEGVEVSMHVRRFSPNPMTYFMGIDNINVKTDKQGNFNLRGRRGLSLSVEGLNKPGYEYDLHRATVAMSYHAEYEYGQKPKASNPQTPALFYMRKKGQSTFIFHGGGGFVFEKEDSGVEQAFDVIRHDDYKGDRLRSIVHAGDPDPFYPDLRAKATWDPKTGAWNVELSGGKPGDGLVVLDQKLYEAPAEGYRASFAFQITTTTPEKLPLVTIAGDPPHKMQLEYKSNAYMYIYLRSREPAIYTRLIFDYPRTVRQDYLNIGGPVDTNPYGERNLEPAVSLPVDIELKLEEEIRSTFRNYGRPQKPDLPQLVRQWEKKRPLTEKLKDMFKR